MATLPIATSPPARALYGSDRHATLKIADDDDDDARTAATDDDAALTASTSSLPGSPLAGADASSRHHDELVRALGVDPNYGLSPLSVEERQREYGLNELVAEEQVRRKSEREREREAGSPGRHRPVASLTRLLCVLRRRRSGSC